ncbi:hypothetical protein ACWGII_26025 [Streptomyces sp. NPDC054855]
MASLSAGGRVLTQDSYMARVGPGSACGREADAAVIRSQVGEGVRKVGEAGGERGLDVGVVEVVVVAAVQPGQVAQARIRVA